MDLIGPLISLGIGLVLIAVGLAVVSVPSRRRPGAVDAAGR